MESLEKKDLGEKFYEDLKRKLLDHYTGNCVQGNLNEEEEREAEEIVKQFYLDPQNGCVPEEFAGEDLLGSIWTKYYDVFSIVRDGLMNTLENRAVKHPWIYVTVDPSYEDTTRVLVHFQKAVLYEHASKAWRFCWVSAEDMKGEMADIYFEMKKCLEQYLTEGIRYVNPE